MAARPTALTLAVATVVAATLFAIAPIGNTGDSPCGTLVGRDFEWTSHNQCGITYTGTAAAVGALVAVAAVLAVVAWRTPASRVLATAVPVLGAAVGFGAVAALAWSAAWYPEPVLRRGWASARDVTAAVTAYLVVLAVVTWRSLRPRRGAATVET